ncbi:hypothetical protein ABPG73_013178 [Tetrahymena malaccensis]
METQNFYPEVELQDSTPKTNKTRVIDIRSNNKIVACAGSGKTTELILAIKKLIEQEKINPDEILVSTFNVESANHLKVKAQEKLQQYDAEKLRIQNIDKFAFEEYEKYLSQSKKMNEFKLDLKEIVLYVLNYLKTVEGKKNVLDQYKYLFFDEFQDINQTQYDILRLFIKNGCDDKQNIYSFRNSSSDFLQKYLNQDIPDLQTSNLKGEDLLPIVQVFQNENEQIEEIVKEIKGLRKFYSWNQMAILSPQRKSFTKFQEFLEKTNSDAKNNTKNEQSNEEDMIIPYYLADRQFNKIFSNENIELPKQQKGIMLSTIHTSKGLEWKAVFIIGIEDKEFPVQFAKQADNQNEKLNECRRMMYVSCTRAKKYLHLSFVEDQRKPYICRFFSDIDTRYYKKRSQFNEKSIVQISEPIPTYKPQNQPLTYITESFNEKDYSAINNILQGIQIVYQDEGKQIVFDEDYIKQNNLQQDFINYLQLSLHEKLSTKDRIEHEQTKKMVAAINWYSKEQVVKNAFISLQKFLKNNHDMDQIKNHESIKEEYLKSLCRALYDRYKNKIETVFEEIQNMLKQNFKYCEIFHQTKQRQQDELGDQKQQYVESYLKFLDKNNITSNIKQDLYNISKLILISEGNKKSLYRDDQNLYEIEELDQNIQNFTNYVKYNFKDIILNYQIQNYENLDIIADDCIFKVIYNQNQKSISKQDIIYHLAYVHELKCKQKIITKIAFYNVISGKLFIFSLNEWNKEEQFYNFLKEKNVKLTEYKFPKKEQNTDQIQSLSLNEIKSSQNTLEKNDSQMQIESIAESQKQEQKCKEEDFETQTQILKSTNQNQIENINSSQTQQNFKNQDINEMEKLASCQGNAQKSQKTLEKNNTEQQNNRNQSQNNSGLADQISSQNKKRKQKMDDSYTEEYLTYLKNKKQKIDENQDNLVLFLIYIIAQCIIFFLFLEKKIRQ